MSSTIWNTIPNDDPHCVSVSTIGTVEPGDDAADPCRRAEQRRRLAGDRREVAVLRAADVVRVAQLLDLALAQPADRAGEQAGDLGAERRGDLRRLRQQEVAGEDRLEIAPLGIDRFDAAPGVGLVDHVVVVQRAEMDELAGDSAADHVVTRRRAGDLGGGEGNDGAKAFAPGDDEVRGDLGEVRVGCLHCGVDLTIDPFEILIHRCKGQERRHLRCDGHAATLSRRHWPGRHRRRSSATLGHAHTTARRGRLLLPLLAIPAAISIGGGNAGAAAPPTIPDGYVELVDDTGLLTVTVPDTWTDVDTVPGTNDDGTAQPWISASPDFASSSTTFDVTGCRLSGASVHRRCQLLVDQFGLPEGACADLEVTPYDDGVFAGSMQVGLSCGEAGNGRGCWSSPAPPTRRSPLSCKRKA